MVIHLRLLQTRTMCSLTHNAAATMISYPRVDLPPRGLATQMLQPTFSPRLPACSVAARVTDNPGLEPSNRNRDQTRIESLVMYSKTYVLYSPFFTLPLPSSPIFLYRFSPPPNGRRDAWRLLTLLFRPYLASTARGRAASPVVDVVGRSMRCRPRLYHRQRPRSCCRCVCGESSWGHPRCKGKERGCCIRRVGRRAKGRGPSKTCTELLPLTPF